MQQFIDSGDPIGKSKHTVNIPIARYGALKVVVKGTTDTGETLAPEDIGRFRLERNGKEVYGESFEFFHDFSEIKGGFPRATLPTAGASRIVAYIPAGYLSPNTWDVKDSDELKLYLEFKSSTLDTRFDANGATWEVLGIENEEIPEQYEVEIVEQDVEVTGQGRKNVSLDHENIAAIFVRNPDDVIDRILVKLDKSTRTNNVDFENLLDDTMINNKVETSGLDIVELPYVSGSISEAVNKNGTIEIEFSGAGKAELTILKVNYLEPEKLATNVNRVRQLKREKRNNVSSSNRPQNLPQGAVRMN